MRRVLIGVALAFSLQAGAQSFSLSGGLARGIPPSVTSIGASHSANIPPSVTSLRSVPLCCNRAGRPFRHSFGLAFRSSPMFFAPVFLPVPVPVLPEIYDYSMDPLVAPEELARTQPAVARPRSSSDDRYGDHNVDRRSRRNDPVEETATEDTGTNAVTATNVPAVPKPQPMTVLIFHDGHKIEVQNYAISGTTLFNLSETGPHQIKLDDLDLDATTKANNDRGIEFHLPKRS